MYTAPTSGGKTLVAEMLMLHRLEEGGAHAKAVFVVPYKAIVDEKVRHFEREVRSMRLQLAEKDEALGAYQAREAASLQTLESLRASCRESSMDLLLVVASS